MDVVLVVPANPFASVRPVSCVKESFRLLPSPRRALGVKLFVASSPSVRRRLRPSRPSSTPRSFGAVPEGAGPLGFSRASGSDVGPRARNGRAGHGKESRGAAEGPGAG